MWVSKLFGGIVARKKKKFRLNWQHVGLGVLAAMTVAIVTYTLAPRPDVAAAQYAAVRPLSTPSATPSATPQPTMAESVALLADKSKPWVLAVLGDSTGNGSDEWVYMAVAELSKQHDRPAIIHNWSLAANAYADETPVGSGTGAPIVVWNASASGMNSTYSMQHRAVMVPEQPNLVIVNHGHNFASVAAAQTGVSGLVQWASVAWPEAPAIAVTLQNPRLDVSETRQAQIVDALRADYAGARVGVVDIFGAFQASASVETLVREDGYHPNYEGETLWAETVLTALMS